MTTRKMQARYLRPGDMWTAEVLDGENYAVVVRTPPHWGIIHGSIEVPCYRVDDDSRVTIVIGAGDVVEVHSPRPADSRFAADGWQYAIRFQDGSITAHFNGSTQREQARGEANLIRAMYEDYEVTVVRRRSPDSEWEEVNDG